MPLLWTFSSNHLKKCIKSDILRELWYSAVVQAGTYASMVLGIWWDLISTRMAYTIGLIKCKLDTWSVEQCASLWLKWKLGLCVGGCVWLGGRGEGGGVGEWCERIGSNKSGLHMCQMRRWAWSVLLVQDYFSYIQLQEGLTHKVLHEQLSDPKDENRASSW